jgi:hypothetical protein
LGIFSNITPTPRYLPIWWFPQGSFLKNCCVSYNFMFCSENMTMQSNKGILISIIKRILYSNMMSFIGYINNTVIKLLIYLCFAHVHCLTQCGHHSCVISRIYILHCGAYKHELFRVRAGLKYTNPYPNLNPNPNTFLTCL